MKLNITKRSRRIISSFLLLFIVLFVFRFIYGYTKKIEETPNVQQQFFEVSRSVKKNYATKKYESARTNHTFVKVDQKYEKIAEVKAKSYRFEEEEIQIRNQIKQHSALIQFERKSGNKGARNLNLVIGVPPENFDALYNNLTKIGKIQAKQITKTDKTNEYKELNAKKASLEKIRASLIALKEKGGKIDEYMSLENRILEIEQKLQELGVSLGDFDDENEFCTVQLSLIEGKERHISTIHRIKVALEWTVKIYFRIIASLLLLTLFALLGVVVIDKITGQLKKWNVL